MIPLKYKRKKEICECTLYLCKVYLTLPVRLRSAVTNCSLFSLTLKIYNIYSLKSIVGEPIFKRKEETGCC